MDFTIDEKKQIIRKLLDRIYAISCERIDKGIEEEDPATETIVIVGAIRKRLLTYFALEESKKPHPDLEQIQMASRCMDTLLQMQGLLDSICINPSLPLLEAALVKIQRDCEVARDVASTIIEGPNFKPKES